MTKEIKPKRRDFLFTATYTIGAVGLGAAIWPLVDQMNPDASVKALSTTEVDVSNIEPGKEITVLWRGKPIFIKRRTEKEISEAAKVNLKDLRVDNPKALENVAKIEQQINGKQETKLDEWEENVIQEQVSNQPDYADIK